jgi:CPA2 family monovalent cation:H+ antiporter-2
MAVPHATALLMTLTVSATAAFLGGMVAVRLRRSPLVGYLLAGMAVGPWTSGVVEVRLAGELAALSAVPLLFGIGLRLAVGDLLTMRTLALPGAVIQMAVTTALGIAVARVGGWTVGAGLVCGLALSVASAVVWLRALDASPWLDAAAGRLAVRWLTVEALTMLVILVLLPVITASLGGTPPAPTSESDRWPFVKLGLTLSKVAACVALMSVGARLVPWLLAAVARMASRELSTLAVTTATVGLAWGAAQLGGMSVAMGACVAGMVCHAADPSRRIAREFQPVHEACTALFFVAMGMQCDPGILVRQPHMVLAILGLILIGKPLAACLLVLAWHSTWRMALTIAVGVTQLGEWSYLLAGLGTSLGLLPPAGHHLILVGVLLSLVLHPVLVRGADALQHWQQRPTRPPLPSQDHGAP